MANRQAPTVSIVVPLFNESAGLLAFHKSLLQGLKNTTSYEIIYCDDGSTDNTAERLRKLASKKVRYLRLSRNFGKEVATTAGIHAAVGKAIITIDADGQHPPDLIPAFIDSWQNGHKVVIGLRTGNSVGFTKRLASGLFYKIFNLFTGMKLTPGATDFRLIDKEVQQQFIKMTERKRMTRALIDWLGFKPTYIKFNANKRLSGEAGYSFKKLFGLAINSVISHSLSPLFVTAYIGAIVLPLSSLLGLFMLVNALAGDPANLHATGSAYLIVFIMFLIGILMMSQGIIGLYLSHIHTETQNRPLYVIAEDSNDQ